MSESLAHSWFKVFMEAVKTHEAASELREAAEKGRLTAWTEAMTRVVVGTFDAMGWAGAAKKHPTDILPVSRNEYLALDAMAFEKSGERTWRFPVAVFELENSKQDDYVAYDLWKVLCVRTRMRAVICYRKDVQKGVDLVQYLTHQVVQSMGIEERQLVRGETMVVVGSRAKADAFPYGFFKDWYLDRNTGRFGRG